MNKVQGRFRPPTEEPAPAAPEAEKASSRRGTRRAAPVAIAAPVAKAKKVEDRVTKYECGFKMIPRGNTEFVIDTSRVDGLKCVCTGASPAEYRQFSLSNLSWMFNWGKLRDSGVERISGHIKVSPSCAQPFQIDIDMTGDETIKRAIHNVVLGMDPSVRFEYTLTLHRSPIQDVCYDEMFQPSEKNDTILVIDGKKLHVNKAFLSYHSDFFSALFSSNFKEGQMDEIPIKDISFEDFGLLMSTIYPKTQFPNDKTAEKLLELADRFIIPSVIGHVEHHLLHNSKIENGQLMCMADKYDIPKLLDQCVRGIDSLRSWKKFGQSPEYKELSKDARAAISDRLMELI